MINVLTLNLNYYNEKHGNWKLRKELIGKVIKNYNPDIIAFQAVATDPSIENCKDQSLQICDLFPEYIYHYFQPANNKGNRIHEGSAIISKHEMLETEFISLSLLEGTDDTNPRVLLKAKFSIKGKDFFLFNAHFSWVPEQAERNITEAIPYITGSSENSLLIGDFNTPPDSPVLKHLTSARWEDVWSMFYPDENGFTFESDNLFTRIDFAWTNPGLSKKVRSIQIIQWEEDGTIRLSDHLGLIVSFDI